MKTAFASVEEKYGITLNYKGARFDAQTATFKIEGVTVGENGVENSRERQSFGSLCGLYGLKPEMLDQTINFQGDNFVVRGLNPRSHKFPVNVERVSDGKGFKLAAASVKMCWEMQNKQ